MSVAPRLPQPLTPESLIGLMRERAYWDAMHPRFPTYQRLVKRGFEILYPGPVLRDDTGMMVDTKPLPPHQVAHLVAQTNREMEAMERGFDERSTPGGEGMVHVQSHVRDGGTVEVADYWRAAPGQGGGADNKSNGDGLPSSQGTQPATNDPNHEPSQSVSPLPSMEVRNDDQGYGYFGADREGGRKHQGMDILAEPGEIVRSPVDGEITWIRPAYKGSRYNDEYLAIDVKGTDQTYTFRYVKPTNAEGTPLVGTKDKVRAGDPIGTVQNRAAADASGNMRNHVHIEIRDKSGRVVNPTVEVEGWKKRR